MAKRLSLLNPDPQLLPGPSLLHNLLSDHYDDDAIAIDFEGSDGRRQKLSYAELHRQSQALAVRLKDHDNRPEASANARFIVPLYIPQSPELCVAQLAVLKAGGAFCPIVLDVPEDRLRFILRDVDASILLTTSAVSHQLPSLDQVEVLPVDDIVSDDISHPIDVQLDPSDAAYIMYGNLTRWCDAHPS